VSAARTTIVAVLVLVLTFGAGLVVGFGLGRFAHLARGGRGPMPEVAARMMLNRLDRHLELTDAQETQIRAIFERRHSRMRDEIAQTNAEIESVLTPEQREKLRKMRMHLAGRERR
jgi:Spy/CpxP family protein refolding chaperone